MTDIDALTIGIGRGIPGNRSMIPRAALHRYCCPNDVYKSTSTFLLTLFLTMTGISEIRCSVTAFGTRTACSSSFASTVNTLCSVLFMIFLIFRLWSEVSCMTTIDIGRKFYATILISAGNIPFTNVSIKDISIKTETAKFLKIHNTTRTRASLIRT